MRPLNERGVSLTELVVAMTILTICVLVGFQSFSLIARGIRNSRAKTIANNLAQERMEVIKNLSYYQVLVTTDTAVDASYTPNIVYDATHYPLETINLWGFPSFKRAVLVSYGALDSNNILTIAPANSQDTGLKVITSYVWWNDGTTPKKVEMRSLYADPNAAAIDSGFTGNVYQYGGGLLAGVVVSIVGNPAWKALSNTASPFNYTLPVVEGTYSVRFSSAGYHDAIINEQTCNRGALASLPSVNLVPITMGTVSGTVWTNPSLLISQVVASTPSGGSPVEYVELYNPTTFTWTADSSNLQLWYRRDNSGPPIDQIPLTYTTLTIAPSSYYLIANHSPITVLGTTLTPDAVYTTADDNVIADDTDGGVGIIGSTGDYYDSVAWGDGSGNDPPDELTEGTALSGALDSGEQYVRRTSTAAYSSTVGNAYDTSVNSANFTLNSPITVAPRNSSTKRVPVSGRPAHRAHVHLNDGFSPSTWTASYHVGSSSEMARFTVPSVATGTWRLVVTSGTLSTVIDNVRVVANADTVVTSSSTSPTWQVSGYSVVLLSSTYAGGFVEGFVYGDGSASATPLGSVLMEANGTQARTAANGYYLIASTANSVTVNANYNTDDPLYLPESVSAAVTEGAVTTLADFHLSDAGRIVGYVTSANAAYPNITVRATIGGQVFDGVSDQTGYFYIDVPADGASAYTVAPSLDHIQTHTSAPSNPLTVTPVAGSSVFAGTITVVGGTGFVTGTVRENGAVIDGGVLIVASNASLAAIGNPPPLIYGSSAPALSNVIYAVSSASDGTYRLEVRASSSLNIRAFYNSIDPKTGALSTRTPQDRSSITVGPGQTSTGQDFSW